LRDGGWTRSNSVELFARYVEFVAKHLGGEIKYWITINEPTVYVKHGYVTGEWPPCMARSWIKAALALRNLARAHSVAYRILHAAQPGTKVGFAHSAPLIVPCNPRRKLDRMAAWLRDFALNQVFFHLIGAFPKSGRLARRSFDFVGLNYYTRTIVRRSFRGLGALVGEECRLNHHRDLGPANSMGWEIYPPGLRLILEKFSRFALPLLITENGVATEDENLRRDFIVQHLTSLAQAVDSGVMVIGYFYWTLMDNFEWALGPNAHFGLAAVDFETQRRIPRPCVEEFSSVCRTNTLAPEDYVGNH
jgi:beta-glucosidase